MIARIRKSMEQKDQGFTLIELLVVMIIIGILAAIAIPVFMNQRKKANDSAAISDVSTLGKEIATYYVDATAVLTAGNFTLDPYVLGALTDVGQTSEAVTGATLSYTGSPTTAAAAATAWCVEVVYDSGTHTEVSYSATGGLKKTGGC